MLGCSVPSGYGTATKSTKVDRGSTCAIWGLGGVGLACAIGCKDSGASKIVGIDVNPDKFEIGNRVFFSNTVLYLYSIYYFIN